MSSDLFTVKVVKRSKSSLTLEVRDTHYEIAAPATVAFFFSVLHELAVATKGPLSRACDTDQICDEGFLVENARKYVAAVEVLSAESKAAATYRVDVADAKWCPDVERGRTFGTASYDVGEPELETAIEALVPKPTVKKKGAKGPAPSPPRPAAGAIGVVLAGVTSTRSVMVGVERGHPARPSPMTTAFLADALRALSAAAKPKAAGAKAARALPIEAVEAPSSFVERFRDNGYQKTAAGEFDLFVVDLDWPQENKPPAKWTYEKILGPIKKGHRAAVAARAQGGA